MFFFGRILPETLDGWLIDLARSTSKNFQFSLVIWWALHNFLNKLCPVFIHGHGEPTSDWPPNFQARTMDGRERRSGAQCVQLVFSLPWWEYNSYACLIRILAAQAIYLGPRTRILSCLRTSLAEFWSVTISRASWFQCGSTCTLVIGAMDFRYSICRWLWQRLTCKASSGMSKLV